MNVTLDLCMCAFELSVWVLIYNWWAQHEQTCTSSTSQSALTLWIIDDCWAHSLNLSWTVHSLCPPSLPLFPSSTFIYLTSSPFLFVTFSLLLSLLIFHLPFLLSSLRPLGAVLQGSTRCGRRLWCSQSTCRSWPWCVSLCGIMTPSVRTSSASAPSPSTAWCQVRSGEAPALDRSDRYPSPHLHYPQIMFIWWRLKALPLLFVFHVLDTISIDKEIQVAKTETNRVRVRWTLLSLRKGALLPYSKIIK